MRPMFSLFAFFALAIFWTSVTPAQTRTVALTIDDLPFVPGNDSHPAGPEDARAAVKANRKLLRVLARHHVPVTGFVIQKNVEGLGGVSGTAILRAWIAQGLDLGNHSYSHPDFNQLSVVQIESQIVRGEATFLPLMQATGRDAKYFRFPANHTGDTEEKHDAIAGFLTQRGYRLAPCTIETSDWMFNAAYEQMLAKNDTASAARLRADYLTFTDAQIDYFDRLNKQVWDYEPPQIMLIHDNQLNADVAERLLDLFEHKGYRWVTLSEAEKDRAYNYPETFITKYGPMWGYRWANERNVKVNGSLEPDPPQWITNYGR